MSWAKGHKPAVGVTVVSGVTPCLGCGRTLRKTSDRVANFPGTVAHAGHGYCFSCRRNGKGPVPVPHKTKEARDRELAEAERQRRKHTDEQLSIADLPSKYLRAAPAPDLYQPTAEQLAVLALVRSRFSLAETRELADCLGLLVAPPGMALGLVPPQLRTLGSRST